MTESEPTMAINPGNKSDSGDSRPHSTLGVIDPWEVAKAAAEDHYMPRMDGTVAPDHVQEAFEDGFAEAVERLPGRDEIAVMEVDLGGGRYLRLGNPVADAVLALIRKRYVENDQHERTIV